MRVGWILIGDRNTPSSRLEALLVHDWLNAKSDVQSTILSMPYQYDPYISSLDKEPFDCDIVIFQKVCLGKAIDMVRDLKKRGIKTIYILDDLIVEAYPMCQEADVVISGDYSSYLAGLVKEQTGRDMILIPNPYETDREFYKKEYSDTNTLKAVWYGTMLHSKKAREIDPILKELGYSYEVITAGPFATKQWTLGTVWNDVIECDVVVIPYLGELPPYERCKGPNRAVQGMVMGLPVICSPIPTYVELIKQGKTGLVTYSNTPQEWKAYLSLLRSKEHRERIGKAGREAVIDKFHIDTIGRMWLEVLHENMAAR